MSYESNYSHDAVGITTAKFSKSILNSLNANTTSSYYAAIKELNKNELKSVLFLLMDFIGTEEYLSFKSRSGEELQKYFEELCLKHSFTEVIFIELLGTIKKYKVLRTHGICKHQFLCMNGNLSQFWNFLYDICESLDDSDIQKLRNWFQLDSTMECAEDILCHLYNTKKINEEDGFEYFIKVLTKLQFNNTLQKVINYKTKKANLTSHKNVEAYWIRDPSPGNPCGLAIIINQQNFTRHCDNPHVLEDRMGSEIDKQKLQDLWCNFGFCVETYDNLSVYEIETLFQNLAVREKNDFDIFILCLLSHGDKNVVFGSDSRPIKIDLLISIVANTCPFLNKKPKLFFIQACQGRRQQQGVVWNKSNVAVNVTLETDSVPELTDIDPEYCDVYKATSTLQNYVSYRSPECGSLFITELVENLKNYGHLEELEITMKRVKNAISKKIVEINCEMFKQMPITSGTLRKQLIFKKGVS